MNKFSATSSESSTELNTAIAERIARAEKAYTQEQKMDLWNDVREHQIKGSDKYKNTIDNAVSDELKSKGVNISRPTDGQQSFTDPHELKDAIKKEASNQPKRRLRVPIDSTCPVKSIIVCLHPMRSGISLKNHLGTTYRLAKVHRIQKIIQRQKVGKRHKHRFNH